MKAPSGITMHSVSRSLEVIWDDGETSTFTFEFLRVMSPSAEVQGHTPSEYQLQVGKRDVGIVSVDPVGAYAVRITFSDGHDSGLYSWDYFEHLSKNQDKLWQEYLDKLEEAGASRDPSDPRNKKFEPKPKRKCGSHA